MSGFGENHCRRFSLDEIQKATNDFNESKIIGKGGFGRVYKGVIDDESTKTLVAVKRTLDPESKQGIVALETEIQMLSKCKHSNLVNLLGYCNENQEMILVYEYMSEGNLADHLYGNHTSFLTWKQRLKICIGVARGLDYLHNGTGLSQRIVHLDIKSDNILLDDNLAAKVADMGLSQIVPANQPNSQVKTGTLRGTQGYMDPKYFTTGTYSTKSDVYSFGVVLLEVLTGTCTWGGKIIPESDRADWIQQHIRKQTLSQIVDPRIVSKIQHASLKCFVHTAYKSLQLDCVKRPSMSSVVAQLESALELQGSSTVVDEDDPFEEGETSTDSAQGNAPNVFGEQIGNKQMALMGLHPTRADRALAAYRSVLVDHDTRIKALNFLTDLSAAHASFLYKTLCIIYNATGETLNYVTSRNYCGETAPPYTYPIKIHNGQWGAFLHVQNSLLLPGSIGGVVYRVKYSDNAFCDSMVIWASSFDFSSSSNNSAYCEINEVGHFDVTDWDAIFRKAQHTGQEYKVTRNGCVTEVFFKHVNPSVFGAVITQVGVKERCAEIDKANLSGNITSVSNPSTES